MDFTFTEEQQMVREMVREFVDKELRPAADRIDKEKKIPKELLDKGKELGFFGIAIPEEYGGSGMGKVGYCILVEELARGCGSYTATVGAHQSIGAMTILLDGQEEVKRKYLPRMATGEFIAAFALTEPGAGSDAAAMSTTAERDGDDWILNGMKCWITNGPLCNVATVFAVTDKALRAHGGVTAFAVEMAWDGCSVGKIEDKMGIRGSETSELYFENVRVPAGNVIGELGKGFLTAMKTLDVGRTSLGAGCVGGAKEALDVSIKYAKQRVQFGKPIARQQAIQWMLAEMGAEIYAMESLVYRTAWMADQGMKMSREAAMTKFFCSEALDRIVDKAVQVHGGMGYSADYPVERFYRDSRINRIFEGTNEIQRIVTALDLIKRGKY